MRKIFRGLRRLLDWLGDIGTLQGLPEHAATLWKFGKVAAVSLAALYALFGQLRWEFQVPLALVILVSVLVLARFAVDMYARHARTPIQHDIALTPLGGSPEVRLTIHNKGPAEHFRAEAEIVGTRNNPNKPRIGVYTMKWVRATTRKVRIQSDARDNLLVARVNATREQVAVALIELAGEKEAEFDHLLWGVEPNQELPEFDLRITVYAKALAKGAAERMVAERTYTLRPAHYSGSRIELVEKTLMEAADNPTSPVAPARGNDLCPRAIATFRREGNEILLDVHNVGTAGEFWGEISASGRIQKMTRHRCVWSRPEDQRYPSRTGASERTIPKGDTGTMLIASLDGRDGLLSWLVWSYAMQAGLHYPVQPQYGIAFGVDGAPDADISLEILVFSKPDMPEGVMRRRLRIIGSRCIDVDSGEDVGSELDVRVRPRWRP